MTALAYQKISLIFGSIMLKHRYILHMNGCDSYREIEITDRIDMSRVHSFQDTWGIIITDDGKIRVPTCCYDDVFPLLTRKER